MKSNNRVVCIRIDENQEKNGVLNSEALVMSPYLFYHYFTSRWYGEAWQKEKNSKYLSVFDICRHVRDIWCHVRDGKLELLKLEVTLKCIEGIVGGIFSS